MYSDDFISRHRLSPNQFIRNRILTLPLVVLFLLHQLKASVQAELDTFFQRLQETLTPLRFVTKSAFTQARAKLNPQAFQELNRHLIAWFVQHRPVRTWNGFRLLALDGSTLRLPSHPALGAHFGYQKTPAELPCVMARVSQVYDLLNHLTLDACIAPYTVGELQLALHHRTVLSSNDLVLLDRGYPAFWFFAWLQARGTQFCARVSPQSWNAVRTFHRSGRRDQTVLLHPNKPAKAVCHQLGLPVTPIPVRLLRIELGSREIEILATSLLEPTRFPTTLFSDLYAQRWGVEEHYKTLKCRLQLENFSGLSVHAIQQDFHAKILVHNLAAILIHSVEDHLPQIHTHLYRVNVTQSLSHLKSTLLSLFHSHRRLPVLQKLFLLFQQTLEPLRPHRTFPQKRIFRERPFFSQAYKPYP